MEYFYLERDPKNSRASFCVNHPGQLAAASEDVRWLDQNYLDNIAGPSLTPAQQAALEQRDLRAINRRHPCAAQLTGTLAPALTGQPSRPLCLHLVGCGDVGAAILIGLRLLGGGLIGEIGLYDSNFQAAERWEFELNQIADLNALAPMPAISVLSMKQQLFNCDIFVFCASAGVPDLACRDDVRLRQYAKNAALIGDYAVAARRAHFPGLFAVVSDPVDLLCRVVLNRSNEDDLGSWDGLGLFPEQIEGFGLGVMHGRAAYFARRDSRFTTYLTQGQAFGPHGQGLVIANSIAAYDDTLSRELTELAANANLTARATGFKPYAAPAIASAVLPLLATLRGKWHYSCTALGDIFMGARNRRRSAGLEVEVLPLPMQLRARVEEAAAYLASLESRRRTD